MVKKRKNKEENEQEQGKPWKNVAYFDNFCDADTKKAKYLSENDKIQVKVKRCGPEGTKFVIKLRKNPLFEEKVDKKGKKKLNKGKKRKDRA
tara:strand:+ start:40 stop:315 length:276 start_codon:yes stop_codon:yes gene_type:complete